MSIVCIYGAHLGVLLYIYITEGLDPSAYSFVMRMLKISSLHSFEMHTVL